MLLGYLCKESCGIGLCFGQSFLLLPRFSWILIVHDVWMLNCLDVVESWRDWWGPDVERNEDKGYVGVHELSWRWATGDGVKWSAIRKLTIANNIDVLCIQETKKDSVDAYLCQYLWGDSSASWECLPSSNTAGGLLCIWNNGSFAVDRRVLGRGFIMLEGLWLKEDKRVEDRRTALGNQFVGLQTRWWRMDEWQSIHGSPNKIWGWRIDEHR